MLWLVGAAVYLICEAVAAARLPGYSYTADYISDLGVSAVMNVGAFATHGVLFLAGAVVLTRTCSTEGWAGWAFLLAAAANAVGNIVVATFRSGAVDSSGHAHWHVVGAGMAIVGGNVAVIIAGLGSRRLGASRSYRLVSVAIGVVGLACLARADHRRRERISASARRPGGTRCGVLDHRVGDHDRRSNTPAISA